MFILRQTSVKMAVLLHKQAKVPYSFSVTVCTSKVIVSQSNDDRISYITPLQIWHNYGFGRIGNTSFPGIRSLKTKIFKTLLLFQFSEL